MKELKEQVDNFLQTLPIKDHIKEFHILHNSYIKPVKTGELGLDKYDLKLHTHYLDEEGMNVYVVIGIIVKD